MSALYLAEGARILNRAGDPVWMTLDDAEREAFRLTAELVRSETPDRVVERLRELAWAIREARLAAGEVAPPPPPHQVAVSFFAVAQAIVDPERRAA